VIEIKNVVKRYGKVAAIDGITMSLPDSGIYCLLGRNGAGKTTLLKMMVGHIAATDGHIAINGTEISPRNMPQAMNYIESGSEQFDMRVGELIDIAAQLQEDFDMNFARKMAERFDLDMKKRFRKLSFGMKTMLTSIMTLSNNSKAILLDEPTTGFDAIMRDQFNTLLLESYHANPRLIIVSTHLIDEVAKVTERLIVIEKGKLLIEAGMDDIDEKAYTLSGSVQDIMPLLSNLNCIGQQVAGNVMAAHIYDDRIQPPQGVAISGLSLQDFFINIVGGRKNA